MASVPVIDVTSLATVSAISRTEDPFASTTQTISLPSLETAGGLIGVVVESKTTQSFLAPANQLRLR